MEEEETARVYLKGPEFLRKQMELEGESREGLSAVERLAASKARYVRSQQGATSDGSSTRSHGSGRSPHRIPAQSHARSKCEEPVPPPGGLLENVGRRSSSKKRPDSLLLYRHKCDLLKGNKRYLGNGLERKPPDISVPPPPGPAGSAPQGGGAGGQATAGRLSRAPGSATGQLTVPDPAGALGGPAPGGLPGLQGRGSRGVSRSHSDVSSRYSKNFADFDVFFQFCGLDGEVVRALGRENFSAHSGEPLAARSASSWPSEGGFSGNSGNSEGLQEEELSEKTRQGTSIVERNARIIQWLYSCRNAQETGKTLRALD